MPTQALLDPELEAVAGELRKLDPDGRRTARVLRETLDQLYDGQRTGRYKWDQLYKTEKTHCGTLVEINLHREFDFPNAEVLDYQIAGVEVDCKYSQTLFAWMIPPEARGHLCLVVWAEDQKSQWSMGLVRTNADRLRVGSNRDLKTTLNKIGCGAVLWLFQNFPLSPNVLLQLSPAIVDRIMAISKKSGQQGINELFRNTLGMRVGRSVIATVGLQADFMKRVRYNGGARSALKPEGILILGQYKSHATIAQALGIAVPGPGEFVPVRVAPAASPGVGIANIRGGLWQVARDGDPIVPAPQLPRI